MKDEALAKTRARYKDFHTFPLASFFASNMTYRNDVLLWITEWGIWPSSENWHLYYTLRNSLGDRKLLHEAPGHLFLNFEYDAFATFLQISMDNGWGGYVLTGANHTNAFFSHDEYIDFYGIIGEIEHWLRPDS